MDDRIVEKLEGRQRLTVTVLVLSDGTVVMPFEGTEWEIEWNHAGHTIEIAEVPKGGR